MREKADRARQNRTRKWLPLICRSGRGAMLVFWLASPSRRAAQWQPSLAAGVSVAPASKASNLGGERQQMRSMRTGVGQCASKGARKAVDGAA